jgi:hypothetical protein
MFATNDVLAALVVGAVFSWPVLPWLKRRVLAAAEAAKDPGLVDGAWALVTSAGALALLLVSLMQLSSGTHNPFIYYWF